MTVETFEYVTVDGRKWMKIEQDNAFLDILEGFESYRPVYDGFVPEKYIAVQAGGYCGVFPRLLGEMFQTVYTFEPDFANFHCLVNNCYGSNIIKAQGALGNEHGMVTVSRQHPQNRGMTNVKHTPSSHVPVYIIDDLDLPVCNLIQLDTEGYEHKILQGAKNTIIRHRPLISVEDSTQMIQEYLEHYGYKKVAEVYRDTVYKCER